LYSLFVRHIIEAFNGYDEVKAAMKSARTYSVKKRFQLAKEFVLPTD